MKKNRMLNALRDYGGLIIFWILVLVILGNAVISALEPSIYYYTSD